nr:Zinc finger domain containing protein [Haemonchus contortus]
MPRDTTGPSQVVCRYFANGFCTQGDRCTFLHVRNSPPDLVCRYYQRGSCQYGSACRYDHIRPKQGDGANVTNGTVPSSKPSTLLPKPVKLPKPGLNTDAAEFIPSWKRSSPGTSYAVAAGAIESEGASLPLCPYFEMGECNNDPCQFVHGLVCDMCSRACIHPYDEKQQKQHFAECLQQHEMAMEQAFAEAKSVDKCCGICMENIMEKALRFGILEGCRHCFCLDCIREWRRNQTFETDVVRSCPECRQHSNFVIPSTLWVEDEDEKRILCEVYRNNMAQKQCKYYKEGVSAEGCPFGNKCFYKHQLPDGSIDPGEEPHARKKPFLADFIFNSSRTDEDDALDEVTAAALDNEFYLRDFFMRFPAAMYERVLDEVEVARDLVDAIRATTDAPLHACIDAAKTCMTVMAPFLQDEAFSRIQKAVREYVVCVSDCYDYRLLSHIKQQLEGIFNEKDELSFSSEQDDNILIKYLRAFSDCADQNESVRYEGLCCIAALVDACRTLIPFLLNSRLPEVLASEFQTIDNNLTELHLIAIKLLTKIYSTDRPPPLNHFEVFDCNFFMKIVGQLKEHPSEILDLMVNFSFLIPEAYSNAVILALESNPCPLLGQLLVKAVNEETSDRRLKFFIAIAEHGTLYKELFYENDLDVLSHVVARELGNSDDVQIRSRCMECIARLAETGHCDRMVREAVENSDFDEELRSQTLAAITEYQL